jgi:hypothetical protein
LVKVSTLQMHSAPFTPRKLNWANNFESHYIVPGSDGKQKKLWQPEYDENLPSNFHSVHGVRRTWSDFKKVLTLENGVEMPFGKMTEYKNFDP